MSDSYSANRNETILKSANRLAVLRNLAMVDTAEEPFFDRLTDLASEVIGTPVSLVTMVTSSYQFFKSSRGLPEPWQSQRRTPLTHSFCQHVVTTGQPLVVEDAREHDLVKDNMAIPDLNVIGYLGMPLQTNDGWSLGSFCVIDDKPHTWTKDEIAIMRAFGDVVNAELDARGDAYRERRLQDYIKEQRPHLDGLESDLKAATSTEAIIDRLNAFRDRVQLGR